MHTLAFLTGLGAFEWLLLAIVVIGGAVLAIMGYHAFDKGYKKGYYEGHRDGRNDDTVDSEASEILPPDTDPAESQSQLEDKDELQRELSDYQEKLQSVNRVAEEALDQLSNAEIRIAELQVEVAAADRAAAPKTTKRKRTRKKPAGGPKSRATIADQVRAAAAASQNKE